MPSVTKCTVELGRGHPAGTWWVSTNAGPHAWFPPQPCATSNVRRPVSTAPSSDQRPRRCLALGSDTLNVMGSEPPVWNATSPEFMYQSNTSATPSLGSATKPSSDMDMMATSFDIARSFPFVVELKGCRAAPVRNAAPPAPFAPKSPEELFSEPARPRG